MLSDILGPLGSIALAILGIGFLIFIHEGGHFLAARAAGVRVEVFSLGFGPRLFGFRRGVTDYRVSALPIGGYVLVAGADPSQPPEHPDDLVAKGFFARAVFYCGGIAMNAAFSILAFAILFKVGVPLPAPVLGTVSPGGAAWQAGLRSGDRILAIDGQTIRDFNGLRLEIALADDEEPTALRVRRGEETFEVELRPEYSNALGFRDLGASPAMAEEPILVVDVDSGSPAERSGLQEGDAIVAINGVRDRGLAMRSAFDQAFRRPGPVELTVLRSENESAREVDLRFQTEPLADTPVRIGVAAAADHVEALRPTPSIAAIGLEVSDRILSVNNGPEDADSSGAFLAAEDLSAVFRSDQNPLRIRILRAGAEKTLEADLDAAAREELADSVALGISDEVCRLVPQPDTPASEAGIRAGDVVLRIGAADQDKTSWTPTPDFSALVDVVKDLASRPLGLEVRRGTETVLITPVNAEPARLADPGFGVRIDELSDDVKTDTLIEAMSAGWQSSVQLVKRLYLTVQRMFTGDVASKNLSGIVGISRVAFGAAEKGFAYLIYFLALISMNLAFFNLLPIPLFDGGSLLFLFIEKIKGSPVDARVMGYTQLLGLAFLIFLMLYVTYNDIARLL